MTQPLPDPAVDQLWPAQEPMTHPLGSLPLDAYRPRIQAVVANHRVLHPQAPVVDAHNHLGRWLTGDWAVTDVPELVDLMDECDVQAVVNLDDGRWGAELEANLDRYDRAHEGRFVTFAHLDWSVLRTAPSRSSELLVEQVHRAAQQGARGLKIWKDLGLLVRDAADELVLLDDPRLSAALETAGELGLPVGVHSAYPVAFFESLDATNERLEQLLRCPEWAFQDRDRFPAFPRLMEALETAVADHPDTQFVGFHVGCWAENLDQVRRMLETYPHYAIDVAARLPELGRVPRAAAALLRDFAGRVPFGTDSFPLSAASLHEHYCFFETSDECYQLTGSSHLDGRWPVSSLALDLSTLRLLYGGSASRLIPGLASSPASLRPDSTGVAAEPKYGSSTAPGFSLVGGVQARGR